MRVGAENRNKVIAAGGLMLLAVVLFARMILVDSGPSASAPLPSVDGTANPRGTKATPRRLSSTSKTMANAKRQAPAMSLDPRLRLDLLRSSEEVTYAGTGRNIFLAQEEAPIPKPVESGKVSAPQPPPGPPPPPPIDLKFFGFASRSGERRRVFLSEGEDVFIAGEGDIVNRRYKLARISPSSVEVEDVLNPNRHQSIPLTQNPQGR